MSLINDALKRAEKDMQPRRDADNRLSPQSDQSHWSVPKPRWTLILIVCLMISAMAPTAWLLVAGSGSPSKAVASPAPPIFLMSQDVPADDETQHVEVTPEPTPQPQEQEPPPVFDEIPAEISAEMSAKISAKKIPAAPEPNRELSGIVHGPRGPSAIVNGRFFRVGQTVKGAKILRINTHSVVLQAGDKQITLRL